MHAALCISSLFVLVSSVYSKALSVDDQITLRNQLDDPIRYDAPQGALNNSIFETVKEYPDGYTGYHCSIIGNFRYILERCSQHVWECIDGKLFKKTCPGELIYWFRQEMCHSITSRDSHCKHKVKWLRGGNWPISLEHAAKVKNASTTKYPVSTPLLITTDCRKVMAGRFEIKECYPEYVICDYGRRNMEPCPEGLVFDERYTECVTMELCKGPFQNNTVPFQKLPWNYTPETIKYLGQIPPFDPILITIDCKKNLDDGYEIEKCNPSFIQCQWGQRHIMTCPLMMVFKYPDGCILLNECKETMNEIETTTPFPIENIIVEEPLSSARSPDEIALVRTVQSCIGKRKGRYAIKPCQAEYMYCYSNTGNKLKCSEGLVFSRRFRECVGEEFCDE